MEHYKSREAKITRWLWIAFYFAWLLIITALWLHGEWVFRVGLTGFFILIAVTITAGVRNS